MNDLKRFFSCMTLFSLALMIGCSEDDESLSGTLNLNVNASGSTSVTTGGRKAGRTKAAVEITDFQISIRDVEFRTDLDDDGIEDDSREVGFRGPYQLDLINGGDAISQTLGSTEIPNGTYDEVRFKFHKDEDLNTNHPLYDRSIYISGTIDGTPFEMWHDTSENLDIGKNSGDIVIDNNVVNITVNFTIEQFLNSKFDIDLNNAFDGNEDGLIEINPNDPDGNKELAELLKENIKEAADLLD